MITLKLIHPKHGICGIATAKCTLQATRVKKEWRYKYGKKYDECTVEITGTLNEQKKKVFDMQTGETFESIAAASKATGYCSNSIILHCRNRFQPGGKHLRRFKYATEVLKKRPAAIYTNKNHAA